MNMTLTNRDKMLLIALAGVLVFFVVYMTVCKDYGARRDIAEAHLTELTPQLQQLQAYAANQKAYENKTKKIRDQITTELERFPTDLRSEHIILNAKELQDALGITVQSVGYRQPALITALSLPVKNGDSYQMTDMFAFTTGEDIRCTLDYNQFKSLLDFIYSQKDRTALKSISVTYNSETGGLSGTASITKYFITPDQYVYKKADVGEVQQGVSDPFGTSKAASKSSASKSSGSTATASSGTNSTQKGGVTEIHENTNS